MTTSDESADSPDGTHTTTRQPVDRAAAFAETTPPVPRTFIYWVLGAVAVLGLGGLLIDHLLSSAGLNPVANHTASTPTTKAPSAAPVPKSPSAQLNASVASFMGLRALHPVQAPSFSLLDQAGQPVTLGAQASKVVVLTFFNGPCNDICPILSSEISLADTRLGPAAANVEFLTINTDPSALAVSALAPAAAQPSVSTLSNWHILTGPLQSLNQTWRNYGVGITVAKGTKLAAHNDVMYFIDPQGMERFEATPFANESRAGSFSLPAAEVDRWGTAIASYAGKLAAS